MMSSTSWKVVIALFVICCYCLFALNEKKKPKDYNRLKKEKKKNGTKIQCEYCKSIILKYHKERHLKKCSTKLQKDMIKNQSFYDENIHFYGDYRNYNYNNNDNDNRFDEDEFIERLIKKYNEIKDTLTPIIIGKVDEFSDIKSIYLNIHKNKIKLKHCKQIELIIYYIYNIIYSSLNQINKNNYFLIEFGAGKGGLGSMFYHLVNKFLLIIDINSKYKTKEDNRIKSKKNKKRIQCGLQHLNLNKLDIDSNIVNNDCIIFSKHLCGAATDFGLRCIINNNNINSNKFKCKCIGIAMCCRTLCTFDTYCNIGYFMKDNIDLIKNKNEWNLIRKMSHWGIDHKNDKKRNEIGLICRRLIDEGRVQYLIKNGGFKNVQLIQYCHDTVTLENIMLLAY